MDYFFEELNYNYDVIIDIIETLETGEESQDFQIVINQTKPILTSSKQLSEDHKKYRDNVTCDENFSPNEKFYCNLTSQVSYSMTKESRHIINLEFSQFNVNFYDHYGGMKTKYTNYFISDFNYDVFTPLEA